MLVHVCGLVDVYSYISLSFSSLQRLYVWGPCCMVCGLFGVALFCTDRRGVAVLGDMGPAMAVFPVLPCYVQ